MDKRIEALKKCIEDRNKAGVRYNVSYRLIGESLEKTAGEPVPIRRAKAFAWLLDHVPQAILPYELIVGSVVGMWPLAERLPSYEERKKQAHAVIAAYKENKRISCGAENKTTRFALIARDHYEANIAYEELQRLTEEMCAAYEGDETVSGYEIGRELENYFQFDYRQQGKDWMDELPWETANHFNLNYGKVLDRGLHSLLDEAKERMGTEIIKDRQEFYQSVVISLEAAIRFINRYADTICRVAEREETDGTRVSELREMGTICRRIAGEKPGSFREALQLLWMVHIIASVAGGSALSFARFDQYMYPFYIKDTESGRMTREEAKILVGCMWLKVNEPKMRTVQSMCLSGITRDGEQGANALTDICLEICGELKLPYPNTSVRLCGETPGWLFDRIISTLKENKGNPMLLNDEKWIPNLQQLGYRLEDARDYYNMGCVEMMVQGKQPTWRSAGRISFPGIIELVFRNGEENMAGEKGVRTGELSSFDTFEKFFDAYRKQLAYRVEILGNEGIDKMRREQVIFCDPFASALVEGCMENGVDLLRGGSMLRAPWHITAQGLATAADSLSAIRKFVYEEKTYTLEQIFDVLEKNFTGYEEIRLMLEGRTECYGNDIDEADGIAADILGVYADAVHCFNREDIPGIFVTSVFSYTLQVRMGETVMATANGRRKGTPLSDNAGPSQGKDKGGPTRLINSVIKLDHAHMTGGYAFNLKINPDLFEGKSGRNAFKGLVKTYFQQGGLQMQFNFISHEILREAQKHPENYEGLLVRVAGFCEYFNNLDKNLQDEIISRTMHEG